MPQTRLCAVEAPATELSSASFFLIIGLAAARQGILPKGYDRAAIDRMRADAERFNCRAIESVTLAMSAQATERGDLAAAAMLSAFSAGAAGASTHEQAVARASMLLGR
jgi:hypothetical protein